MSVIPEIIMLCVCVFWYLRKSCLSLMALLPNNKNYELYYMYL